ncbi:unnamed protein product [Polarella glacialis]|uniref:Uncharacterized protein n=1 Tax=Polarella glacialis TaxID=89957 RepID=A0A813G8Y3_POLGL|nr:unnamed protein product [Polarella glacialis]
MPNLNQWKNSKSGLLQACLAYRSFVISVLSFVWQLEDPPPDLLKSEVHVLRCLVPGPGNWISKKDLFHLADGLGFPASFPSIVTSALAAKLRVLRFDITDAISRAIELRTLLASSTCDPLFEPWYRQAHVFVSHQAQEQALNARVTARTIAAALSHLRTQTELRKSFQKEATIQLLIKGPDSYDVEFGLRCRFCRWQLQLSPRIAAVRSISLFRRLAKLVKPRVWAAVLRTHLNGWCTQRRFQQIGVCIFQCSPTARDCIEHYCFCDCFKHLHLQFLRTRPPSSMQEFLMLDHPSWDDDRLILNAVAVFALYIAFNWARLNAPDQEHILSEYLKRSCYHAVLGHARSQRALQCALDSWLPR